MKLPTRGATGHLSHVVIDTPHPMSHSPPPTCHPSLEKEALTTKDDEWTLVLPEAQLGPHREHYFQLESAGQGAFTHVRVTIFPDGGFKRVRVFGNKVPTLGEEIPIHSFEHADSIDRILGNITAEENHLYLRKVLALPLTPEAFAPFGQVIQSYTDTTSAPRAVKITQANFGTASKYHKLSLLKSSYPEDMGATTGISVYRCQPAEVVKTGTRRELMLNALERHPFTDQSFLPMGHDKDNVYLVVVAKNGLDDRPDIGTLRAFAVRGDQGIVYNTGVWHQPMTVLDKPMDFVCVETQIGNGDAADCEVIDLGRESVIIEVA